MAESSRMTVGPLLDSVLPYGVERGNSVVLSSYPGVGVSSLTFMVATHAAQHGNILWLTSIGEREPAAVSELSFWLGVSHPKLNIDHLESPRQAAAAITAERPVMCVIDRFFDVMGHRHATQDGEFDLLSSAARAAGAVLWLNTGQDRRGIPFGVGRRLGAIDYQLRLTQAPGKDIHQRTLTVERCPPGETTTRNAALRYDDSGIHRIR